MYANNINSISNVFLRKAAKNIEKRFPQVKFRSIHMDPWGECAISYFGYLPEELIKKILQEFLLDDINLEDIHLIQHESYEYSNYKNRASEYTTIYTPDGDDYREWQKIITKRQKMVIVETKTR